MSVIPGVLHFPWICFVIFSISPNNSVPYRQFVVQRSSWRGSAEAWAKAFARNSMPLFQSFASSTFISSRVFRMTLTLTLLLVALGYKGEQLLSSHIWIAARKIFAEWELPSDLPYHHHH